MSQHVPVEFLMPVYYHTVRNNKTESKFSGAKYIFAGDAEIANTHKGGRDDKK